MGIPGLHHRCPRSSCSTDEQNAVEVARVQVGGRGARLDAVLVGPALGEAAERAVPGTRVVKVGLD